MKSSLFLLFHSKMEVEPKFNLAMELKKHKWKQRLQAVKIAKAKPADHQELLLELVEDRRPSKGLRRLLGEPFYQVGFIRRDVWSGLCELALEKEKLEYILPLGLCDPYYEVRTQVYKLLAYQISKHAYAPSAALQKHIWQELAKERNMEVLIYAISAVAWLGCGDGRVEEVLCRYAQRSNWQVRNAVLHFLKICVDRGTLSHEAAEHHLKRINMRTDYFKPVYELKKTRAELQKALLEEI